MAPTETPTTPRQEEILDRTFELVRESGLANLTMKKVADRMGFTEPALYRHFPNKQALVLGLLGRLESLLLPEIETASAREDLPPVERLERIILHHLGLILKSDGLPFLILAVVYVLGAIMTPPEGMAVGAARTDRQLVGTVVAATYVVLVAACFAYFYPIYSGQSITYTEWFSRMWLGGRWV